MTEVTVKPSAGAIEAGEYVLEVDDAEEIWLDDQTWDELDGPEDSDAVGDPTGKYSVTFKTEDDFTLEAQWWLNDYEIGPDSGLGQLMARFDQVADFEDEEGKNISLDDIFAEGTRFQADVIREPDGDYMAIDDVTIAGHDDDDFEDDDEQWGTSLMPLDTEEIDTGEESSEVNGESTVYEAVAELDDPQKGDLISHVAGKDGDLVSVVNEMIEDGRLEEADDGTVSIAG